MGVRNRKGILKGNGSEHSKSKHKPVKESKSKNIDDEKKKRQKRSLDLIATFKNGFTTDWHFAVPECFKSELDIKLTQRIEVVKKDGKVQYKTIKTPDGNEKRKRVTISLFTWTQGSEYSFAEGHALYDTPNAYLQWNEALQHIKLACHILQAVPNKLDATGHMVKGFVKFKLSKPDKSNISLETIGQYDLSQAEFVKFLKSGNLPQ